MDKSRILIVDDEPSITKLLQFALERSGRFEVRCENDGLKALASAKAFLPHLVLLDVNLPGITGGEISAQLQEDPSLRRIPVIYLTGMVSQEEMGQGLTIGGHPAIAKPVQLEKLIECIEANLPR